MALDKKGTDVPSLVVLTAMVMIVVFSSCAAADYCKMIGPCKLDVCYSFCLAKNYTGDFETFCVPSMVGGPYLSCCCRVPG
ncbi:hypothetical protein EJB05_25746, partial [Eragrostis curvula]